MPNLLIKFLVSQYKLILNCDYYIYFIKAMLDVYTCIVIQSQSSSGIRSCSVIRRIKTGAHGASARYRKQRSSVG